MTLKGILKTGKLSGKHYSVDFGLDVVYVQVLSAEPAYSDYRILPDTETYKDRYVIVDFDRSDRVVGFTIEGLIEDYRNKSLGARLLVDLGLIGIKTLSERLLLDILEFVKDQLPSVDEKGKLLPAYA